MNLTVQNLSFGFRCWDVLHDVSFSAESGSLICVLGKNGAGKSTLFRCLLKLLPFSQGDIRIDGTSIRRLSAKEMAQKIAYIPQKQASAFQYSALDVVLMGTTPSLGRFHAPGKRQYEQAERAMAEIGIADLAWRNYLHLSGGEQQLVLIARAIAQQTRILVMDEPCSSLDFGNQVKVMKLVKRLAGQGYLILLSIHNPQQALLYADRIMLLLHGKICRFGSPDDVIDEEILEEMYGTPIGLYPVGTRGRVCVPAEVMR